MSCSLADAEKMKVDELKTALSSRQLSTTGKKTELVSRLMASIQSEMSSTSSSVQDEEGIARKKQKFEVSTEEVAISVAEPVVVPAPTTAVKPDPEQINTDSSNSQSANTAWNLASADASLPAVRGRATVQLRATSGFSATAAALATNANSTANASSSSSTAAAVVISPSGATKSNDDRQRVKCPYLDTINRHIIDTDMEKVSSVFYKQFFQ